MLRRIEERQNAEMERLGLKRMDEYEFEPVPKDQYKTSKVQERFQENYRSVN